MATPSARLVYHFHTERFLLPGSMRRRIRWGGAVRVPTSLQKLFRAHGLDNVTRVDTRPDGFCGWYMLAFYSQCLTFRRGVARAAYFPGPETFASAVQYQMKRIYLERCRKRVSIERFQRLLSAIEAGLYADTCGFNFLVWYKRRFRGKHKVQWNYEILSYRPGRRWWMAYNNTDGVNHWEVFVRRVERNPVNVVNPSFSDRVIQPLLTQGAPTRVDPCTLATSFVDLDLNVNFDDYTLEGSCPSSSTSQDDYDRTGKAPKLYMEL